jgi:hypothetical protein
MLSRRFICTLRMPITFDVIEDYIKGKPVISNKAFSAYVEQKRPSLKDKPYKICI